MMIDVNQYIYSCVVIVLQPSTVPMSIDEDIPELDSTITNSWTCEMNKLWTRANKIVHIDRIARLTFEGNMNEVLLKRNLQEQTANKFRELFASTYWEPRLAAWLHETLLEHLNPNYIPVYLDSLQILRHKVCIVDVALHFLRLL